ncbi:MAG TPA: CBS domain-containing protein [Blastocatellia bacterium]|nr:CBS domain-containing protein [Blastocatellia bacterium]
MSRSKEGIDRQKQDRQTADVNQTATPGAGESSRAYDRTSHTWGRESQRDFPRRSTSYRDRSQDMSQTGGYQGGYGRTRAEEYGSRREGASRYQGSDLYRSRGEMREDRGDIYARGLADRYRERGYRDEESRDRYRAYEQSLEMQRDPYRRQGGRATYQDRFSGSEYNRTLDPRDRAYDDRRTTDWERGYEREDIGSRRDRDLYADPYYRESFSGRFGDYDTERTTGRGYSSAYETVEGQYEGRGQQYGRRYVRCGDIMTRDVSTCSPQTSLREVADMMKDEDVGSIPVVDNGRIVGIVTDRDIVCRVLAEGRDTRTATASEAMSQDLVTVARDESVVDAIQKMAENQVRRLPVVDVNGRLRGIISMADIALEAERDRELAQALEQISQPTPFSGRRR